MNIVDMLKVETIPGSTLHVLTNQEQAEQLKAYLLLMGADLSDGQHPAEDDSIQYVLGILGSGHRATLMYKPPMATARALPGGRWCVQMENLRDFFEVYENAR